MGTQRKILLAMIALMLIAFIVSIVAIRINKKRENLIIELSQEALEITRNEVVKDQESKLYRIIYDYTYWDDFVNFIQNPDEEWAEENISTILSSFGLNGLWMIDLNQKVLYSNFVNQLGSYVFEKDLLSDLHEKRFVNFYDFINDELFLFYGATIHPTSDADRLTDPFGYFFLVKKWDEELIDNIQKISDCELFFMSGIDTLNLSNINNTIQSSKALYNWKDEQVGSLIFIRTLPLLNLNKQISNQMQLFISSSVLGMILIIILLLNRLVSRPLKLVGEIIEKEDVTKIDRLKQSSSDFARIGNLIEKFVDQKKELEYTMHLAQASDRLKTAFLNNISHEVRTPLNGIVGATLLISDPSISLPEREELSELIQISTERLLRTITEYMDISLLNSDSMPIFISDFKMSELIKPLNEEYAKACCLKNIAYKNNFDALPVGFILRTDKNLLGKVLQHMLENAVKFTSEGSVSLLIYKKPQSIEFNVVDTGVGIEKKFHSQIFVHFEQEDSSNMRQYDGSGLGLAISKKICDLIGAEISFDSEKGKGCSFKIVLPL
ncbi:MAG: ATP-binding protein [Bacteroidales bacterium]|nr:ATP-binding protein [Bacteroidales bacterium]